MDSSLHLYISTILVAGISMLGGLWIATKKPSWYTQERLWMIVAIATGLLLGIAFFEFIPHSFETNPHSTPYYMAFAVIFMIIVETKIAPKLNFFEGKSCSHDHAKDHDHKKNPNQEHQHHLISHHAACSALGCLIVCAFFDGFQIRSAFLVDIKTGWITSLSLLFHLLPDGVLAASIAIAGGMNSSRAKITSVITGGTFIIGSVVASFLGPYLGQSNLILSFAAGLLIYVVFIHLLPVGMKHKNGLYFVLLGLLIFVSIQSVSH